MTAYNREENIMNTSEGWPEWRRIEQRENMLSECKLTTYQRSLGRHAHVVIAEAMLGRKLTSNEVVHHINGDKHDNRPENLRVMNRADHARLHANQYWQNKRGDAI